MWPRSLVGLFPLLQYVLLKQIQLTCKSRDRPFCGTYQPNGEDLFELANGDRVFQIIKDSNTNEHCVSLRQRIKLCGKPNLANLVRVKDGKRCVLTGYTMVFDDLPDCIVDDIYGDCESDQMDGSPESANE